MSTSKLKFSERVKALRPDATGPGPDGVPINGWLGPSGEDGRVRIYRTKELDVWADVDEGDVIFCEETQEPGMPDEMVVVWVRADAAIRLETHARREVQADFLRGDIMGGAQGRPAAFWGPETPLARCHH